MGKEAILQPQLQYLGIDKWLSAGFTGKGITVWNSEPLNSDHGAKSAQMLLDVAPGIKRLTGTVSRTMRGDVLESCTVTDDQDGGKKIPFEDFIAKYQPQIISSSNKGTQLVGWTKYIKELQNQYNFTIFNCAYNDGDNVEHESITCQFPIELSIVIGALEYRSGNPQRASYSSVGRELDFSQLIGWWSGTSAATPVQAAMAAIIMNRYGHMSQDEMYRYLQMIAKDLQAAGHDVYTGWGQPILPDISKRYVTMTTASTDYYVDGVKYTMDTKPVNKGGNIFVPIRAVSEGLGKTVDWEKNTNKTIKVIVKDNLHTVTLNTGSTVMYIDGRKVILNFAPYIDGNNRTLVPIRAIAEAFGCKADWVQKDAKVMILEQ